MSLESLPDMMRHAQDNGYAVGYFESWNLESLQAVLDAAETTRSPVIIGFNGEFMSHGHRIEPERLELYGVLGKAAAESARVPCGFIFNECCQDDWLRRAITAGFNTIMPSNEKSASLEAYQRWVGPLTEYAHRHGVAVEAEIGTLPNGVPGENGPMGELTDPSAAAAFVADTGVDLVAVSIGNVHIQIRGRQALNLEHLAVIKKHVQVPLVLHGGTGIADESLRRTVAAGVAKVNFGTNLKQRYLAALRTGLADGDENPHHLLGFGGSRDLLVAARRAVREAVTEKMALLGCCGKG